MLLLVGLGLETGDLSVRAADAVRGCVKVYLDGYTVHISSSYREYLRNAFGEIEEVERSDLEEESYAIINISKSEKVAVLVGGDPLVATTHRTLLKQAEEAGVDVKIYHGASIFSAAIGESGLDIYKFGRTTTVPFWSEKYKPVSFIDVIKLNLSNKEHTLLLLDIKAGGIAMSLNEAFDILRSAERASGQSVISGRQIVALADVGADGQFIAYGKADDLEARAARFNGRKISLIIPSDITFAEEEAVERFCISDPDRQNRH